MAEQQKGQKVRLQNVAVKQDTGDVGTPVPISATFENVIDNREGKGNYTVAQLFDAFMDFITNADFVYYGAEPPANEHMRIWIDTAHKNL